MTPLNKGLKFDRDQILNKYWELAQLDPDKTKGNILGQLKALDSLCEQLAAGDKPKSPANRLPEPDIYRAAWMPEACLGVESPSSFRECL